MAKTQASTILVVILVLLGGIASGALWIAWTNFQDEHAAWEASLDDTDTAQFNLSAGTDISGTLTYDAGRDQVYLDPIAEVFPDVSGTFTAGDFDITHGDSLDLDPSATSGELIYATVDIGYEDNDLQSFDCDTYSTLFSYEYDASGYSHTSAACARLADGTANDELSVTANVTTNTTYTSTADFDTGTKFQTWTNTDNASVPVGEVQPANDTLAELQPNFIRSVSDWAGQPITNDTFLPLDPLTSGGELIYVVIAMEIRDDLGVVLNSYECAPSSAYTDLFGSFNFDPSGPDDYAIHCARIADGTSSDLFNFTANVDNPSAGEISAAMYVIGNHTVETLPGDLAGLITAVDGTGANPDSPTSGPITSNNYLVLSSYSAPGFGGSVTCPTSYTDMISEQKKAVICSRELAEITSENPGAFTAASAADWYAVTTSIPGQLSANLGHFAESSWISVVFGSTEVVSIYMTFDDLDANNYFTVYVIDGAATTFTSSPIISGTSVLLTPGTLGTVIRVNFTSEAFPATTMHLDEVSHMLGTDWEGTIAMYTIEDHTMTTIPDDFAGLVSAVYGASGEPNPPNLDTGVSIPYLFLATATEAGVTGTVTACPASYSDLTWTNASFVAMSMICGRQLTSASENPGNFATSTDAQWYAITVAIPGTAISYETNGIWRMTDIPANEHMMNYTMTYGNVSAGNSLQLQVFDGVLNTFTLLDTESSPFTEDLGNLTDTTYFQVVFVGDGTTARTPFLSNLTAIYDMADGPEPTQATFNSILASWATLISIIGFTGYIFVRMKTAYGMARKSHRGGWLQKKLTRGLKRRFR